MPSVPLSPLATPVGAKPTEAQMLMAAAEQHSLGRLVEPERSAPQGPERPRLNYKNRRTNRPLKVVK